MKKIRWDKIKEGTLLIITWRDTQSTSDWLSDNAAQNFSSAICKSVGWFINSSDIEIKISSSVAEDGDKNIEAIPIGCIENIKKINYKR